MDAPSNSTPTSESTTGSHHQRVLVVEDIEDTGQMLQRLLQRTLDIEIDLARDGAEALEMIKKGPYSVVITDLRMPRLSGMDLLRQIQTLPAPATVIVTTGHGSINEAVEAMKIGAYHFLTKPPDPEHLCLLVQRALAERALRDELAALRTRVSRERPFGNVLTKNARMSEILNLIANVADSNTTVLIEGETGTGKEQVARAIHAASSVHRKGPLIVVNCAALPENLLESELFGHEKGAFTSALGQRKGRFELADGGTLFLDEVSDIPPLMQVKLLRVLQEREFERVGGTETIPVDVRVIAASNRNLAQLVTEGKFRQDLYYRLNVLKIDLPPLRERPEDISLLATHFTEKYARPGMPPCQIDPAAMERLIAYHWPGNIRELENAIERAVVTASQGVIRVENLPAEVVKLPTRTMSPYPVDLSRPLHDQLAEITADFERRYLRRALRKTRGHIGRAARLAGLSRRSVTMKVSQYKIDTSEFKK